MKIDGVEYELGDTILVKGLSGSWWERALLRSLGWVGITPQWLVRRMTPDSNGIYTVTSVGSVNAPWKLER